MHRPNILTLSSPVKIPSSGETSTYFHWQSGIFKPALIKQEGTLDIWLGNIEWVSLMEASILIQSQNPPQVDPSQMLLSPWCFCLSIFLEMCWVESHARWLTRALQLHTPLLNTTPIINCCIVQSFYQLLKYQPPPTSQK